MPKPKSTGAAAKRASIVNKNSLTSTSPEKTEESSQKKSEEEEEDDDFNAGKFNEDLIEQVCVVEHLHEHPLTVVSDSTLNPDAIGLRDTATNRLVQDELSGAFRCNECGQLRYGRVYVCRQSNYRACEQCAQAFLEEQAKLIREIEEEEQNKKLEEKLKRLRKVQNITQEGLNIDGLNPFMEACVTGDLRTVKDRIDRNEFSKNLDLEATVETGPHRGRTALLLAAQHGHHSIVMLLLSRGADAETLDNYGMTPLMHSAHKGHLPVLNELLFANVTVDRVAFCGYTALLFAANGGHPDCVRRLVAAKANPGARTPSGRTGLIIAAFNGHISTVRYFLHHTNVDPEAQDDEGYSARHAAIAMKESNIERILSGY